MEPTVALAALSLDSEAPGEAAWAASPPSSASPLGLIAEDIDIPVLPLLVPPIMDDLPLVPPLVRSVLETSVSAAGFVSATAPEDISAAGFGGSSSLGQNLDILEKLGVDTVERLPDVIASILPLEIDLDMDKAEPSGLDQGTGLVPGDEAVSGSEGVADGPALPPKKNLRKLFLGGLTQGTTEEHVFDYFSTLGTVTEVIVKRERENPQRSRGFGFVTFKRKEEAQQALLMEEHSCGVVAGW